jgi:hypothetical protein
MIEEDESPGGKEGGEVAIIYVRDKLLSCSFCVVMIS